MSLSVRGISSGIDINGIIEELMHVERQPIRREEAMIERTEQIAELWREVNSRIDMLKRTLPPLQNKLTYTAPVPTSSDTDVLTAKISGIPAKGSYRFNVGQLATRHTVATAPPDVGARISNTTTALGHSGTFYLGTGREVEGLSNLTFDGSTNSWLRGSIGAGFQVVRDGNEATVYTLKPDALSFTDGLDEELDKDHKIEVYMHSFTNADGEDIAAELEAYFDGKGWAVDLEQPLFVIEHDGSQWAATAQHGGDFAFLGDHPMGTFSLRGEVIDASDPDPALHEVTAVNNFDFEIRSAVDETNLVKIGASDSLATVVDKINAKSFHTGVSASIVMIEDGDYRLLLESAVEGGDGFIQAYDYTPLAGDESVYGEDPVLQNLHFFAAGSDASGSKYELTTVEANDARFTLNGLELIRSSNTFTNVISGLEVTLKGDGPATLDVSPDIDGAVEEISLFVQTVNETNTFLRMLQKNEEGPLQGSGDLMRIERQLRTLIHGIVPDVPGSSHLTQPLNFSGAGSGSATATGVYTGTADTFELTYHSSAGEWRFDGEQFESGDIIHGLRIDLGPGDPGNLSKLTLPVSPASYPLTYYNNPGSTHSNQLMTYSGSGSVTAMADGTYTGRSGSIQLTYNGTQGQWMHDGARFTTGSVIDGIRIDIEPGGTPSHLSSLSINVTAPSDPRSYNSLASIGIMSSDEAGILEIDDAKLRAALADDPESIFNLFGREAPRDENGRARGPHGIAGQMQNLVDNMLGFNGLVQSREAQLQRQIDQHQNRIEMLERRMEMREDRLVRQFTFMEQYIARIQEQTGLMASFEMMTQGGSE